MCKLEENIKQFLTIEMKTPQELTCYETYNNYTLFIDAHHITPQPVHNLFRISNHVSNHVNNHVTNCIVDTCNMKSLGGIYVKIGSDDNYDTNGNSLYKKRSHRYCSECFREWRN